MTLVFPGLMLRSAQRARLEAWGRPILRDATLRVAPQDEAEKGQGG